MTPPNTATAHVGDWIAARGVHGQPSRRGQIVELLGHGEHEHYRVHWDEQHESILYPADGIIITPQHARPARRADDGTFPHESLHARVKHRLAEWALAARELGTGDGAVGSGSGRRSPPQSS